MPYNDYYSASFQSVTATSAERVLLNLKTGEYGLEIAHFSVTQTNTSTSAQSGIAIVTLDGDPGGTALSEEKLKPGNTAADTAVTRMVEGYTTSNYLYYAAFNILNGWLFQPPKDARPQINTSNNIAIELVSGFDTSIAWSASVIWREI